MRIKDYVMSQTQFTSKSYRGNYLRKRNRGFSLLEIVLVLGIAALMSVLIMTTWQTSAERIRAKGVADKLQIVTEAAKSYVKANAVALQTLAPTSGALVIPIGKTSVSGAIPTGPSGLKSVQGGGFLPVSFIDTNSFGQNTALLVKKAPSGDGLEAIVTTYGGREMPDDMLGHASNSIGARGGYVPKTYILASDADMVLGNYGGWRTNANSWGPASTRPSQGHLQTTLAFDDSALLADYLYRDNIGIEEANRMATNIDMDNNDLNNVDQISAGTTGTVEVVGDLRATIDIYARDAYLSRNLQVTQDATVGRDLDVQRDLDVTQDVTVGRNVVVNRDLDVKNVGNIHDLKATYLDTNAVVYGGAVSGTGQSTPGGDSSTQVTLGDLLPKSVAQYSYLVMENSSDEIVYKPTCKGGYSRARVMVYPLTDSWRSTPDVRLNVIMAATNSGESFVGAVGVRSATNDIASAIVAQTSGVTSPFWRIKWIGTPVSPNGPRRAIAQTFCYYGGT
jgi:type II secretory pathway pseudopilin PulG